MRRVQRRKSNLPDLSSLRGSVVLITGGCTDACICCSSPTGGAMKRALAFASAFFNEIRLRRVKYGFAMWNSYAVKYLLRKCEEANFISHRTKWDISQFSQENYFTFGNAEYFTKFKSCIFVLRTQEHHQSVVFFFYAWNSSPDCFDVMTIDCPSREKR